MNLAQIRQSAEMYCGVAIEDDMLLQAVNEALEQIGDLAFIDEEVEVTAIDADWNDLPEGTTSIINVTQNAAPYQQWQTRGYKIKFVEPGTYIVALQRMPNKVESVTETPECHPLFHQAIGTYLRSFVKLTKDDTNQDGHNLKQEFKEQVARAAKIITSNRKR